MVTRTAAAVMLLSALEARGLRQQSVAETLGISQGFLSRILRGYALPGRDLAIRIQDQFAVPVDQWSMEP